MTNLYRYIQRSLNAPFVFLLKLLFLHLLLKLLFWSYNVPVSGNSEPLTLFQLGQLLYWSITNDLLVILCIQVAWFLSWSVTAMLKQSWPSLMISLVFLLIHWLALVLNLVDVFYFHFQRQRANADLLYVTRHPFHKTLGHHPWLSISAILLGIGLFYILFRFYRRLKQSYEDGWRPWLPAGFMILILLMFVRLSPGRQLPTYPLISLNSHQLLYVQNSFHSFLYSMYRNRDGMVARYDYMPSEQARTLIQIQKQNRTVYEGNPKKNIVLFIMESIPQDFFDEASSYKAAVPFLDSIRKNSLYFDRAYSYSHHSNKGIVSVLAGMPTLTEIPLYHSSYTNLPITPLGARLADSGYRSLFFIGDDYDDFGFAKCVHWLGFNRYYSKTDVPGYQTRESHTMGLHDEYVLQFMGDVLKKENQPFLAVHYNTSTHYPNDLPAAYREPYPKQNRSAQMKSFSYYNRCLQDFFERASSQSWFPQTVFLFCSDHWMYPDAGSPQSDVVQGFRIPILIYDPQHPVGEVISDPVSQLDMMNTILAVAGDQSPFISYGENLLERDRWKGRVIVSRENANLYQVFDSTYVLGYNPVMNRTEFCYDIRKDPYRKQNLLNRKSGHLMQLETALKAFLQRSSEQYTVPGFKP